MRHWSGPLSVALLSTPDDGAQITTAIHKIRAFSQGRIDLHIVGSDGVSELYSNKTLILFFQREFGGRFQLQRGLKDCKDSRAIL